MLNEKTKEERLGQLREIKKLRSYKKLEGPSGNEYIHNHIHSTYSFSPYSPAEAAYTAWANGLATAGLMDHDSVAGAEEFLEAGEILGLPVTVGIECRCGMNGTPFEGRHLNNPDQRSVSYMSIHGIPKAGLARVQEFFTPCRLKRNARNRKMISKLNEYLSFAGIVLDFDADIVPVSQFGDGGSITERHILYALALKLSEKIKRGKATVDFLNNSFGLEAAGTNLKQLLDIENELYPYTLLNIFKAGLVEKFYVDADDECPSVSEMLALSEEVGGISTYPYLGDVTESVTGDKKAQRFEDGFLDELVAWARETGFRALTYMPTRNTYEQLGRIKSLCEMNGLFQISGEDINSPYQSFVCNALEKPEFAHLIDSAYALIGHEKISAQEPGRGMFSDYVIEKNPPLYERIKIFAAEGRK